MSVVWSPPRNAKDNPLKVVIAVPDANATAELVVAAGGTIVSQASRSDLYDNRLVVVAKDLDGYILNLVQYEACGSQLHEPGPERG
jgi:predicted enzyme related to lactoylglutathione lyase